MSSYRYQDLRATVLTDQGQRNLLIVIETARRLFASAGAATFGRLTKDISGDSWEMLALVDRLVELGKIRCVTPDFAHQESIYVPVGTWAP